MFSFACSGLSPWEREERSRLTLERITGRLSSEDTRRLRNLNARLDRWNAQHHLPARPERPV